MRVTANIASIPERNDLLVNTINSLIDQVDQINLFLNGYQYNPYFHEKVKVEYSNNEHGDAGKFYFCELEEGYYFTCDDDLIYPDTYIQDTIKKYQGQILTYHGRSFLHYPINSYYKSPCEKVRCLDDCHESRLVQFGGTGVMMFHLSDFCPSFDIFKRANMADIWIGIEADKQDMPIIALKHDKGYIEYQPPLETIYDNKVRDCQAETDIVNDYFLNTKKN